MTLDVQFQTNSPPLHMITNQLKENTILGWLLYVIRPFLQVGFRFQYQFNINLVWLSINFSSFSWSQSRPQSNFKNQEYIFRFPLTAKRRAGVKVELKPHYLLFRGFTFFCFVQLSKKPQNVFFTKKLFFSTPFAINLFFCIKRKQTME